MSAPEYSIIVPAWNEEAVLPQTLAQLRAAADGIGRAYELIVVDDDSSDRTAEVSRAAGARVVQVKKRQIAAVRNAGAQACNAPYIIFCDADTFVPETVIRNALLEMDEGAVGGGARVAFDSRGSLLAENNVGSATRLRARIANRGNLSLLHLHHACTGRSRNFRCAITAVIINNNKFIGAAHAVSRGAQLRQSLRQYGFFIPRRNNDGIFRRGHLLRQRRGNGRA